MKNKSLVYVFSILLLALVIAGCQDQSGQAYRAARNQTNQTGNLYVASSPTGANLYVDNILKGTTPRTVTGLTVGNHAVKLTKTGYYTYTTTKYIYAEQTVNLTVTLTQINNTENQTVNETNSTHKVCSGNSCISIVGAGIDQCTSNAQCNANQTNQTGNLYVASSPTGASLYVDNILKGTTPKTVAGLTVGNHAVKLTKTGYYTYTTTKYIYAEQTVNLTVTLTQINNTENQTNSSSG